METATNAQMALLGAGVGVMLIAGFIVAVLTVIAYWKIFTKAGKPGWHSIIPFLNVYDEFDICWNGVLGLVSMIGTVALYFITGGTGDTSKLSNPMMIAVAIIAVVVLVLGIIEKIKLSKAFGHGIGFALGLIFLSTLFMLILGFGSSRYVGKEE